MSAMRARTAAVRTVQVEHIRLTLGVESTLGLYVPTQLKVHPPFKVLVSDVSQPASPLRRVRAREEVRGVPRGGDGGDASLTPALTQCHHLEST